MSFFFAVRLQAPVPRLPQQQMGSGASKKNKTSHPLGKNLPHFLHFFSLSGTMLVHIIVLFLINVCAIHFSSMVMII